MIAGNMVGGVVAYVAVALISAGFAWRAGTASPLLSASLGALAWTLLCQLLLIPVNAPGALPGPRRDAQFLAAYVAPLLSLAVAALVMRPLLRGIGGAALGVIAGVVLATVLLAALGLVPSRLFF